MPTGGDGTAYMGEASVSKSQQRFMGMVYAYKKGEMPNASDEVKKAAEGMSKKDAEKYASTKHAKLPEKVEEKLDKKDIPFLKDLAGKLSDGAKKHKKQSEKIKLALNTEDTAIESELVIQDWNSDDIKFTEIETVDIIKAKPLKESMTDKEFMKTDVEMKNNAAAGVSVSQEKQNDYVKEVNRRLKLKNQKKVVAGEQEFKTKVMKKEHYDWRDELDEDWQKVNRKDKTDGMSQKAVNAYRKENPGSKLKTAVTKDPKKLKKGSKSAKRRLAFCRRMKGMKKKLTSAKTRRDPDSRINKALRRWNC